MQELCADESVPSKLGDAYVWSQTKEEKNFTSDTENEGKCLFVYAV